MKNLVPFIAIALYATAAFSAGDPPQTLDAAQAQSTFGPYKTLLTFGCPGAQAPTSGTVTGGDSPFGGSQTITLSFDGGATVKVVNSWGQLVNGGARSENTVTITCCLNK